MHVLKIVRYFGLEKTNFFRGLEESEQRNHFILVDISNFFVLVYFTAVRISPAVYNLLCEEFYDSGL